MSKKKLQIRDHKHKKDDVVFYPDRVRLEVMRCTVQEVYRTFLGESDTPCCVEYNLRSIIYDNGFPQEADYDHIVEEQVFGTEAEAAAYLLKWVQTMMQSYHETWSKLNSKRAELQTFLTKERAKHVNTK